MCLCLYVPLYVCCVSVFVRATVSMCLCVHECFCVCLYLSVNEAKSYSAKGELKDNLQELVQFYIMWIFGKKTKGPFSHFKVPGNFERIWADD